MPHSALTARWEADEPVLGAWTNPSDAIFACLRSAGYDMLVIDCQHGTADEGTAADLIRGLPSTPHATFVRVQRNDPGAIGRVLDAGADGVIVPLIDTADDAAAAVAACRYLPRGGRSFGPTRADLGIDPAELEARVSCFVMVETETAVGNIDAICAVPGLAGIYVGPVDLGISLGVAPVDAANSPLVAECLRTAVSACNNAGIIAGVHTFNGASASKHVGMGFRFLTVGSDTTALLLGARTELEAARQPS